MPSHMSSKPNEHRGIDAMISADAVMMLSGPDATAFSQAQFANDVSALAPGRWQWNAWLSPKGRVIALFRMARIDPQTLLAVLPDFSAAALVERLGRFVFRSKVALQASPMLVRGEWREPTEIEEGQVSGNLVDGIRLGIGSNRELLLGPGVAAPGTEAGAESQAWRLADIRAGIPRLHAEDSEAFTAHMLGLDALGAFSLKKGCFPGHEILARSHYLGQVKRGLRRVHSDTALPARGALLNGEQIVGHLLCSASGEHDVSEGLAVLPLEADPQQLAMQIEGQVARLA